jgi:F-box-like
VTISILPDDVLLEIFDYVAIPQEEDYVASKGPTIYEDGWHTLVHVCKRWRCIVFASPLRLDLRIVCTNRRPVEKVHHIWPPFPIYVWACGDARTLTLPGVDNIIAALNEHNRVSGILIDGVPDSLLKRIVAIKSFPALEELGLVSYGRRAPIVPDSFLGGSTPCLRTVWLGGISFPGLGKLLSTSNLINLYLHNVPHSGYISPEAMVASLSTLTGLKEFDLRFRSPRIQADRENQTSLPLTRVVLPALTRLRLKADSEYLEDIISRIDAPLLDDMKIMFFHQIEFDTPQLRHFISRTEQFKAPDRAFIHFYDNEVILDLSQRLSLNISCRTSGLQILSIRRLYDSALSPLPTLKSLEICDHRIYQRPDIDIGPWLGLLHLFSSVEDLILSATLFGRVAQALGKLAEERVTEMLPVLQNIFLEGPHPLETVSQAIGKFVAKRRLLGCPVTVYHRDNEHLDYVRWEIGDR